MIAATSSTVILPHDFFAWLALHVSRDDARFRRFVTFWGYSWFAIVKGWHVAEFSILFVLVHTTLARIARSAPRRDLVLAAAFSLLFAVSDEYHQSFVPGRGGHWSDVVIDRKGIGLAATIAWYRGATPVHGRPPEG